MGKVTVTVPDDIKEYIKNTDKTLYVEALREVARKNIGQEKKRLKQLSRKNGMFEKKYSMTYREFQKKVPDTPDGHDDWIEWTYVKKVYDQLSEKISRLDMLLGK